MQKAIRGLASADERARTHKTRTRTLGFDALRKAFPAALAGRRAAPAAFLRHICDDRGLPARPGMDDADEVSKYQPKNFGVFCSLLKSNTRLTSLNVSSNYIRDVGGIALCDALMHNPNLKVLYNGSACVVAQTFTETVTNVYENVTTKVRVVEATPPEEWLAAKAKAKALEEALKNTPDAKANDDLIKYDKGLTLNNDKRKPQNAQTLMGFCILLGSLVYTIAGVVAHRRKMKMELMQLKEMELEMEAEKHAIAPENGANTAFGSLEHGGDERGQEMFNAFKWQQEDLSERQIRN